MESTIADFWAWWSDFKAGGAELLREEDLDGFADAIHPRIQAVNPDLTWEIAPAENAEFRLVISGRAPTARATAERLRRSAPQDDDLWEFRTARDASPEMFEEAVTVNDQELDLGHLEVKATFDARSARFDVAVYHPDFAFMEEQIAGSLAAVAIDWALGGTDAERWIRRVELALEKPVDTIPVTSLRFVVDQMAERYSEPTWASYTGEGPDGTVVAASALYPLRPIDFPLYDEHVALAAVYKHADDSGLPAGESLTALEALQARLESTADEHAALVAHTSSSSVRTFHFYADSQSGITDSLRTALEEWSEGDTDAASHADPEWAAVKPFLG